MVKEVVGDLTEFEAGIVCHQTNFYGVMGGGVALSIWNKLLPDSSKREYIYKCKMHGRNLLGQVQYIRAVHKVKGEPFTVANMFCQDEYVQPDGGITRYDCMKSCLLEVERRANLYGKTVSIPGHLGCGIAGGDWRYVKNLIYEVFMDSPVSCTIVYWSGDQKS